NHPEPRVAPHVTYMGRIMLYQRLSHHLVTYFVPTLAPRHIPSCALHLAIDNLDCPLAPPVGRAYGKLYTAVLAGLMLKAKQCNRHADGGILVRRILPLQMQTQSSPPLCPAMALPSPLRLHSVSFLLASPLRDTPLASPLHPP